MTEYENFLVWLQEDKEMSLRSARDVVSRNRRVLTIAKQDDINEKVLQKLIESEEYLACSTSIKSQLKRAVTLYLEYARIRSDLQK